MEAYYSVEVGFLCCQMEFIKRVSDISFFHILTDHQSEDLRESWVKTRITGLNFGSKNALWEIFFLRVILV